MHEEQPRYYNPRPYPATDYRWKSDRNIDMIGLAKTHAGIVYIPNCTGLGRYQLENEANSINEVYRRIDLIFRDRE